MRLLQQRPVKAHKDKRKQDFSKEAQARVLDAHNGQSHPDKTIVQPTSEWEQSQEFEVTAGGQNVLVTFKAFYFSSSHHFEFRGETISPTGYRSDFLDIKQGNRWRSPIEYAIQKAQELNAELLKEQKKRQRSSKSKARGQRNAH